MFQFLYNAKSFISMLSFIFNFKKFFLAWIIKLQENFFFFFKKKLLDLFSPEYYWRKVEKKEQKTSFSLNKANKNQLPYENFCIKEKIASQR